MFDQTFARARERLGLEWTPGDSVVTTTRVKLGWADRFRVLLGRAVTVRAETWVERPVGRSVTETVAYVPWLFAGPPRLSEQPAGTSTRTLADRVRS